MINEALKNLAAEVYYANYNQTADVPLFLAFVNKLAGNDEEASYMAEIVGRSDIYFDWHEAYNLNNWISTFLNNVNTYDDVEEFIEYLDRVFEYGVE